MISAVISYDDNRVSIHTAKTNHVGEKFSPGVYKVNVEDGKLKISRTNFSEIHTPYASDETKYICNTVEAFFKEGIKEKVNALGFVHKLGILLYGRPGTGKTSLINFIANEMINKKGAITFICDNSNTIAGAISLAPMIREIQENPIIFIADEFERYAEGGESEMKSLLDGNSSVENMLFLACTNYLEKVPSSIKDRLSRFRIKKEIVGITQVTLMKSILSNMSNKIDPPLFTEEEIDLVIQDILQENKGTTIDELKHEALKKITSTYVEEDRSSTEIGFKSQKKVKEKPGSKAELIAISFDEKPMTGWSSSKSFRNKEDIDKSNI